jgi:hypothetical protein
MLSHHNVPVRSNEKGEKRPASLMNQQKENPGKGAAFHCTSECQPTGNEPNDPYAPPTADLTPPAPDHHSEHLYPPRSVAAGRGWNWIAAAWGLFKDNPLTWMGANVLCLLITIPLQFIPIVGDFVTPILGPIFTGGLIIGAHHQHGGGRFELKHLFAGFSRKAGPLVLVNAAGMGIGILIMLIVGLVVLLSLLGVSALAGLGWPAGTDLSQVDPKQSSLLSLLPLFLFFPFLATPVAMIILFATALVVLNEIPVLRALNLGIRGCRRTAWHRLRSGRPRPTSPDQRTDPGPGPAGDHASTDHRQLYRLPRDLLPLIAANRVDCDA